MTRFTNMTKRRLIGWVRSRGELPPLGDRAICTRLDLDIGDVRLLLEEMTAEGLITFSGDARGRAIEIVTVAGVAVHPIPSDPPAEAEAPLLSAPERTPPPVVAAAPRPRVEPLPDPRPAVTRAASANVVAAFAKRDLPQEDRQDMLDPIGFAPGRKPRITTDMIRAAKADDRELFEFCSELLQRGFRDWMIEREAVRA